MKIPLRWLADYVTLPASVPQLAERLTLAGLEVGSGTTGGAELNGKWAVRDQVGSDGEARRSSVGTSKEAGIGLTCPRGAHDVVRLPT